MKKVIILSLVGLFVFMLGIYLSTHWIIVGTLLAILGGFLMGGSSFFLPKGKK